MFFPMALAFQAQNDPEGSTWYKDGPLLMSQPATNSETPYGRTPLQTSTSCQHMTQSLSNGSIYAPRLGRLLHDSGDLLRQYASWWVLSVDLPIGLRALPCFRNENSEVGAHA